jgi:AcrR family transcriptional regulator
MAGSRARGAPRQDRAVQTYERLLDVAGELLAEVGVERISTNLICARAGVTPPALYRYFSDKYAVLEALGRRLMDRQNAVLFAWIDRHAPHGLEAMAAGVEELLRETAAVTAAEAGAAWIGRALRAAPRLAHVRIESHRTVTERLVDACAPLRPDIPREILWRHLRIAVELGYALDEMLGEEPGLDPEAAIADAARMLRQAVAG